MRAGMIDMEVNTTEALDCPLLVFYGGLDDTVQRPERDAVQKRLRSLGKAVEIDVFPEAAHDFFCAERDRYYISASRAAWTKTLTLFKRALHA